MSSDSKTWLKEQADSGKLPAAEFSTERMGGTDHEPAFVSKVRLPDGREAQGGGRSKTEAEQSASATIIQKYGLK